MSNYVGVNCPVCNKRFAQADNIVVCPICGAPHHRDCYMQDGACAYVTEHISGKEWQPEAAAQQAGEESEQQDTRLCPQCGAANPSDTLFCQICGRLMTAQRSAPEGGAGYAQYPFGDPFGGVPKDATVGGLPVSDLMYYVGQNSAYYIPRFYAFDKAGNKIIFNFSAFIFNFLYFFYRKMYVIGAVLFVIFVAGLIPSFLLAWELFPEFLYHLGWGPKVPLNQSAIDFYTQLADTCTWVNLGLRTVVAGIATRIYYYKAIRDVSALLKNKTESALGDYHPTLIAVGGVDKISVTLLVAIIAVGLFLVSGMLARSL